MLKWIGLALLFVGIVLITRGVNIDSRSQFEDGSFIKEIALFVGGIMSTVTGLLLITGYILFSV